MSERGVEGGLACGRQYQREKDNLNSDRGEARAHTDGPAPEGEHSRSADQGKRLQNVKSKVLNKVKLKVKSGLNKVTVKERRVEPAGLVTDGKEGERDPTPSRGKHGRPKSHGEACRGQLEPPGRNIEYQKMSSGTT